MGDSWCWGEVASVANYWHTRQPYDSVNNLHQLLGGDGHAVNTIALAGSSNREQVETALGDGIEGQVIWWITDPFRDHQEGVTRRFGPLPELVRSVQEYHSERDRLLRARFGEMRDHAVWLLGGVCAIPEWVAREFPQFRVVCADVCEHLTGRPVPEALCRAWPYHDCDPGLVALFTQQEAEQAQFRHRALHDPNSGEHRYFWPDGRHPNRLGHERIYQELIRPLISDK